MASGDIADDSGAAPFVAVTDYDRRVLRALELARASGKRSYVFVMETVDGTNPILIAQVRPPGVVVTVCTPDGVAVNLSPDAEESLIPGEG